MQFLHLDSGSIAPFGPFCPVANETTSLFRLMGTDAATDGSCGSAAYPNLIDWNNYTADPCTFEKSYNKYLWDLSQREPPPTSQPPLPPPHPLPPAPLQLQLQPQPSNPQAETAGGDSSFASSAANCSLSSCCSSLTSGGHTVLDAVDVSASSDASRNREQPLISFFGNDRSEDSHPKNVQTLFNTLYNTTLLRVVSERC